jgi:hypothetical protein
MKTSIEISEGLEALGVSYSASAVRRAWANGAPRDTVEAFAGWLALNSDKNTSASMAAAEAVGLTREDQDDGRGKLAFTSMFHGLALLVELFAHAGAEYWFAASPVLWMTLQEAAKGRPGDPTVEDLKIDPDFMAACVEAINALGRVAIKGVEVGRKLKAAGYEADAAPWLAMTETNAGRMRLHEMACKAYAEFGALPDGDEPKTKKGRRA